MKLQRLTELDFRFCAFQICTGVKITLFGFQTLSRRVWIPDKKCSATVKTEHGFLVLSHLLHGSRQETRSMGFSGSVVLSLPIYETCFLPSPTRIEDQRKENLDRFLSVSYFDTFALVSANYASMGMRRDYLWRIPPIRFFLVDIRVAGPCRAGVHRLHDCARRSLI